MSEEAKHSCLGDLDILFNLVEEKKQTLTDLQYKDSLEAIGRLRELPDNITFSPSPNGPSGRLRGLSDNITFSPSPNGPSGPGGVPVHFTLESTLRYPHATTRPRCHPRGCDVHPPPLPFRIEKCILYISSPIEMEEDGIDELVEIINNEDDCDVKILAHCSNYI